MIIKTNLKNSYSVLIECHGLAEYRFDRVLADNEYQVREWAKKQPLPHHKIKKIIVEENK